MFHESLTSGAVRVLELATQLLDRGSPEMPASKALFLALRDSPGRAADWIEEAGLHLKDFPNLDPGGGEQKDKSSVESEIDWRVALVRIADRIAIHSGSPDATGTDHLFLGLWEWDSLAAAFFESGRLTREELWRRLEADLPVIETPLDTEVDLRPSQQGSRDEAGLFRILDASANRAREGLRVVEDFVRFQLDDAALQQELKDIRHKLTASLVQLGQSNWIASRDAVGDVGPRGSLASEQYRGSILDVVRAGMKRAEEALRTLEEYGKLFDAELAQRISECRYRMYSVEKTLENIHHNRTRLANCRAYLLVTAESCRFDPETIIRDALAAGFHMIQLREKNTSTRTLLDYARRVRDWTKEAGALLIINDRVDLAAAVGADGVHLGQDDLTVEEARKILGGRGVIGVSTHRREQAREAIFAGADYLGVGPVFPSQTKSFEEFPGLTYVREVAASVSLPWFAIGGIDSSNLKSVQLAGARRIAVSSAICAAPNPRHAASTLVKMLQAPVTEIAAAENHAE